MPENLITLRAGTGPTVVFLHPASGLATAFRRLVPYLAHGGAMLAFENPEPQCRPPSISELGADYWEQLRMAAKDPLVLVGWSFGGVIAVELATLAENAGRDVSAVVLLDAGSPDLLRSSRASPLLDLGGLFGIAPSELQANAAVTSEADIVEQLVDVLRRTCDMPQIEAEDLRPFVAAYRWHHAVTRLPWVYRGHRAPVSLCRARDEHGWDDAPPDLGWSVVLGVSPTLWWVPGTHHSLISEENAPDLARLLSKLVGQGRAEALLRADPEES